MDILIFVGVAFSLGIISAILWGTARAFEEKAWTRWVFGFWLSFLCVSATRYFTGF